MNEQAYIQYIVTGNKNMNLYKQSQTNKINCGTCENSQCLKW